LEIEEMSANRLDGNLPVVDGKLTLTADTLPGSQFGELLTLYNGDMPMVIEGAQKQSTADAVTVTGTCDFMNVAALPVTAVFTEDSGTPDATLRFTLVGDAPGPDAWRFSRSFPQLPLFTDVKGDSDPPPVFLDTLALSNSDFVLTTLSDLTDEATGAALAFGLNFVGTLKPASVLGMFGTLVGVDEVVTLYGPINAPEPAEVTPPLDTLIYPWEATWRVVGISLRADLGIDLKIAGSNLLFHQTELRIYSPTSTDWFDENPTYVPTRAVSGTLDVPSAGISAEMTARLLQNSTGMTLDGVFTGLSLANLAKLFDLAGGGDLFDLLPDDIKKYGEALGGLSLTASSLSFEDDLTPASVSITVGMPNVQTSVLSFFVIESVFANFVIDTPFSDGRSVGLILSGTMDVAGKPFGVVVDVSNLSGRATLEQGVMLPLSDLFEEIGLTSPSDLSVQMMDLSVSPTQGYSFDALMADKPAWELDLGPVPMLISVVQLSLSLPNGDNAAGAFGGTLEFSDDLSLSMSYTLPGNFVIRAEFPSVKLSQLIARLNEIGIDLPSGFDVDFGHSYLDIEKQGDNLTFNAATEIENFGLVAFTAQKQDEWGFAFGLDLETGGLSSIAGLEALADFESFVGLDEIMLVVSTLTQPGFVFPSMSNFNAPTLEGKSMSLPPQASGLVTGINIYASLNTGKSDAFKALAKYLGVKLDGTVGITLGVSLPDPATNSKLFLSLNEELQKGVQLVGEFGLLMQGGEVRLFLIGDVKAKLQGQPVEFSVSVLALEDGVLISGTMTGTIKFGPVHLSNLALVIGMDFEGVPSLGVAATIDVGDFDSSVAVFFDSDDPDKSMFSAAVSDLTLLDVTKSIAGGGIPSALNSVLGAVGLKGISAFQMPASVADSLDGRDLAAISTAFKQYGSVTLPSTSDRVLLVINSKGSVWHLTDMSSMLHYELKRQGDQIAVSLEPQFYCAPQSTYVGTIQFPEGVHVITEIDFLVLKEQLTVLISESKGIAVDMDASPVVIYKSDFFAVTGSGGQGGPRLSLSTYNQPDLTDTQLRPPHFLLSGDVRLLGVDLADVYINVNADGLVFSLSAQVSSVLKLSVSGSFDSINNMQAGGSVVAGVSGTLDLGQLGTIAVNVNVNGSLDAGYKSGTAYATFQGGFQFPGVPGTCNIPKLTLSVDGAALQHIAETLWGQVSDILNKLVLDADQWLTWLGGGIIQGAGQTAEEVGRLLNQVYKITNDEVAAKTQQILKYTSDKVAAALKGAGATADETVQIMEDMGYAAEDIADDIANVFTGQDLNINFGHIDTPAGPHTDIPKAHVDTPKVYTDTSTHADTPKVYTDTSTHADVPRVHTDSKVLGVRTNITYTPHGDTKVHTDTTVVPHGDTKVHTDVTVAPHVDTSTPHTDAKVPPHGDTGTHIDT